MKNWAMDCTISIRCNQQPGAQSTINIKIMSASVASPAHLASGAAPHRIWFSKFIPPAPPWVCAPSSSPLPPAFPLSCPTSSPWSGEGVWGGPEAALALCSSRETWRVLWTPGHCECACFTLLFQASRRRDGGGMLRGPRHPECALPSSACAEC